MDGKSEMVDGWEGGREGGLVKGGWVVMSGDVMRLGSNENLALPSQILHGRESNITCHGVYSHMSEITVTILLHILISNYIIVVVSSTDSRRP